MKNRVTKIDKGNFLNLYNYWEKQGFLLGELEVEDIGKYDYVGVINNVFGVWSLSYIEKTGTEIVGLLIDTPKTFPRLMRVWDDDDGLVHSRMVLLIDESGAYAAFSAFNNKHEFDSAMSFKVSRWKHAEEIIEPKKVTRAYLEDLLDGPFEIID